MFCAERPSSFPELASLQACAAAIEGSSVSETFVAAGAQFVFRSLYLGRFQSDLDDRSFQRLTRSVTFQNTLDRLRQTLSQPFSKTNGIRGGRRPASGIDGRAGG